MKARHEFDSDFAYREYLRTYCAAMAMKGMIDNSSVDFNLRQYEQYADESVRQADALIKALNQNQP